MKILLVEDEEKLAAAIKRALELQNYVVDAACDGESGLDLALGATYDAAIIDLMLPKINGLEICSQIRHEGKELPILILTAKDQISDRVAGLDAGADDYLVKPFSFEELFARIRALVRRAGNSLDSCLRVADLTLDPKTFQVKRGQRKIKLSAKEFSLLEFFMRHPGVTLTRKQIIEHVWNYDADVLNTTVEVHIKHLRDKIEIDGNRPLIRTRHGFGYEITD